MKEVINGIAFGSTALTPAALLQTLRALALLLPESANMPDGMALITHNGQWSYQPPDFAAAPTSPAQTSSTIDLAWEVADPTASTEVWQDDGALGPFTKIVTVEPGVEAYTATGLEASTSYKFKLKHVVASGLASANYSAELTQATAAP